MIPNDDLAAVTEYLNLAVSEVKEKMAEADKQLSQMQIYKFPSLCVCLAFFLNAPNHATAQRYMAGLFLKNIIYSKEDEVNVQKQERWASTATDIKDAVKNLIVATLKDDQQEIRSVAAQVLSKLMAIDILSQQWLDAIPFLLRSYRQTDVPILKPMALSTIGFICEDLDEKPEVLAPWSQDILTVLLEAMIDGDVPLKRIAAQSLYHGLEFYHAILSEQNHGTSIINVILQSISAVQDSHVQQICLGILIDIGSVHYEILKPSIQTIFEMTLEIFKSGSIDFIKLSIEFWLTIGSEEYELLEQIAFHEQNDLPIPEDLHCENYIAGVAPILVPLLLQCLMIHDDDVIPDTDEYTVSTAADLCLTRIAQIIEDDVIGMVGPFIEGHIASENWKHRLAGILAFTAILEGPKSEAIAPLIPSALDLIGSFVTSAHGNPNAHVLVLEAAVWALGHMADLHYDTIRQVTTPMMEAVFPCLQHVEPRIAQKACEFFEKMAKRGQFEAEGKNPFEHSFNQIVDGLFAVTARRDGDQENLSEAAYDAMQIILATAPDRTVADLSNILRALFTTLEATIYKNTIGIEERMARNSKLGHILELVQVLIERIGDDIEPFQDQIMTYAVTVMDSKTDSSVHDEVFLMVGGLANIIGPKFERYLNAFYPYIIQGVKEWKHTETCVSAIHLIGDITRALEANVTPICDEVMSTCLTLVMDNAIPISIKSSIISLFGDICMAIEGHFQRYLSFVLPVMKAGAEEVVRHSVATEDEDELDLIHEMCLGLIEGFQGVVQGIGQEDPNALAPYVDTILLLLAYISTDLSREENISRGCVGIIGDLISVYERNITSRIKQPFVKKLIKFCEKQATEKMTFDTLEYVQKQLSDWC